MCVRRPSDVIALGKPSFGVLEHEPPRRVNRGCARSIYSWAGRPSMDGMCPPGDVPTCPSSSTTSGGGGQSGLVPRLRVSKRCGEVSHVAAAIDDQASLSRAVAARWLVDGVTPWPFAVLPHRTRDTAAVPMMSRGARASAGGMSTVWCYGSSQADGAATPEVRPQKSTARAGSCPWQDLLRLSGCSGTVPSRGVARTAAGQHRDVARRDRERRVLPGFLQSIHHPRGFGAGCRHPATNRAHISPCSRHRRPMSFPDPVIPRMHVA